MKTTKSKKAPRHKPFSNPIIEASYQQLDDESKREVDETSDEATEEARFEIEEAALKHYRNTVERGTGECNLALSAWVSLSRFRVQLCDPDETVAVYRFHADDGHYTFEPDESWAKAANG